MRHLHFEGMSGVLLFKVHLCLSWKVRMEDIVHGTCAQCVSMRQSNV